MFLSVNHSDTKSLDLFDSEETPPPHKKRATAWRNQAGPQKPLLRQKRNSVSIFFDGVCLLLYLLLQLSSSMVGFTATPPVALFVAASALTMWLMSRHCWLWYWWQFPPWQARKQHHGQHQTIKRVWFALMLSIVLIIHLIEIDNVFALVLLFLVTPKKNSCSSPTKSVSLAMSTNSNWTKSLASSSTSSLNTSARKFILNSPIKLPAYHIEWLNYKAIRFEVQKYLKKENKTPTIEKDVSYLLSKFSTIKIYNAFLITVGKLDIDTLTGINELPQKKTKTDWILF